MRRATEVERRIGRLVYTFGERAVLAAIPRDTKRGRPAAIIVPADLVRLVEKLVRQFGIDCVRRAAKRKKSVGRPKQMVKITRSALMLSIDEIANALHEQGMADPAEALEAAFEEALELEKRESRERANAAARPPGWHKNGRRPRMTLETMKRYYREGAREHRQVDLWMASQISSLIASMRGIDRIKARKLAVARLADETGKTDWLVERCLDRAARKCHSRKADMHAVPT